MHPKTMQVFDQTVEKTDQWLHELMSEMGWSNPHRAYSALRAVLHALRDRLRVEEAVDLGAQLPMLIRGFYYEGWRPAGRPLKYRHKEEFLRHVSENYAGLADSERELAVRAVFHLLARHVTGGEIRHVMDQLPAEMRVLGKTPH